VTTRDIINNSEFLVQKKDNKNTRTMYHLLVQDLLVAPQASTNGWTDENEIQLAITSRRVVSVYEMKQGTHQSSKAYRFWILSWQESSQWGQYFCTEENASQLIHLTLHWLKKHDNKNVVFLEPSCGHGQIIWKLLEHVPLAEVIGFDLDNHAIHLCRQYYKNGENTITWIQGDFLQSQPPRDWTEAKTVVCVGGPPYTLRKNNGNETTLDRDLPQLFLNHCLQTWHAEFCAFLLPRRYKSQALELPSNYECETHELMGSSTFLFQGKVEITQPSIIQTFFQVSLLNQCK